MVSERFKEGKVFIVLHTNSRPHFVDHRTTLNISAANERDESSHQKHECVYFIATSGNILNTEEICLVTSRVKNNCVLAFMTRISKLFVYNRRYVLDWCSKNVDH